MPSSASTESKTSKRRTRLDRESILEAALTIAARPGVTKLSVRELGTELGADPTAIYRHFRNKEELDLGVFDALTQRCLDTLTAHREDWENRLRQLAMATVHQLTRHPAIGMGAFAATTHGPGERLAVETILDAFTVAGLDDEETVRHYALFAHTMMSGASGLAHIVAESGNPDDDGPWFNAAPQADPAQFPSVARLSARLAKLKDLELFKESLELVIDSARRTARSHQPTSQKIVD